MTRIPLYKALLLDEDVEAVAGAVRAGKLGMGGVVGAFEREIDDVLDLADGRAAAAVSTGHAALHLGMVLAGIEPGDEVITPALTHLSDVQAIASVGGRPVFCDVDDATLCLDPERVAELVGPRTRAIVSLDYGCHVCDHDAIAEIADSAGLRVVHDAAHSFGSSHRGRLIGNFSDLCVFSFDPVKALSCIDAGVLIVRNADELERVHRLRRLGSTETAAAMYRGEREWIFDAYEIGFRYHLSNVHAALGLTQLDKLDVIAKTRRAACERYSANLAGVPWVRTPGDGFDDVNPFLYYIRVPAGLRDRLRAHLEDAGIETGIHWHPAHRLSAFAGARSGCLTVTDLAAAELISLPLHSSMELDVVDVVCDAVASFRS